MQGDNGRWSALGKKLRRVAIERRATHAEAETQQPGADQNDWENQRGVHPQAGHQRQLRQAVARRRQP